MKRKQIDFAFIVHSRDRSDLPRKFPILKYLPNYIFDYLTMSLPPFVVSYISGLKTIDGKDSLGIVIGIPMTAHQLLEHRDLALKKIIAAVELGKSKGARFFGLGAMTASLSKGGIGVIERVKNVYITTGRTFTVKNIADYVENCVDRFRLSKKEIKIGIVGAAGGIGSGVSILLASRGYRRFVLIDLERKLQHLKKYIDKIEGTKEDSSISVTHNISAISNCDIVIAATSAPEIVIKSEDVQPGTILINDAQPSDISPKIIFERKDVLVIEGGVLHAPSIDCHFNFGLVDRNDIFSCLAEVLIMAYQNSSDHRSIGDFDHKSLEILQTHAQSLNFYISKPQNSSGYISENQIQEFAKIRATRSVQI